MPWIDRFISPMHAGYDVFDAEDHYETTVIVLGRDQITSNVFFKDWRRPLWWPKRNRMRALRRWEFDWLRESGYWVPVKLRRRSGDTWLEVHAAMRGWVLARPRRPILFRTEGH